MTADELFKRLTNGQSTYLQIKVSVSFKYEREGYFTQTSTLSPNTGFRKINGKAIQGVGEVGRNGVQIDKDGSKWVTIWFDTSDSSSEGRSINLDMLTNFINQGFISIYNPDGDSSKSNSLPTKPKNKGSLTTCLIIGGILIAGIWYWNKKKN